MTAARALLRASTVRPSPVHRVPQETVSSPCLLNAPQIRMGVRPSVGANIDLSMTKNCRASCGGWTSTSAGRPIFAKSSMTLMSRHWLSPGYNLVGTVRRNERLFCAHCLSLPLLSPAWRGRITGNASSFCFVSVESHSPPCVEDSSLGVALHWSSDGVCGNPPFLVGEQGKCLFFITWNQYEICGFSAYLDFPGLRRQKRISWEQRFFCWVYRHSESI